MRRIIIHSYEVCKKELLIVEFNVLALLCFTVDFLTVRGGRKARRLLENAIAFSSCVGEFKDVIQCPAG